MTSIGKYKLLDEMGVGAVATTYRASDTFRNREMVVKVLNPAIVKSPELRDQLSKDLGGAAELRHPHIGKVRDLGEVDGVIYIATELLNGVDLRWYMDHKVLAMADKIDLIVQVCGALAFAHSKGVPHGHIKPGNIFVTGKDATILDFGIGKCVESVVAAGVRPAALLPNYFAPEQILGKPFKARSDVFSTAVVLYELLTQYPFPSEANLIPREIVHTVPEPLRKHDPEIPEELETLMTRALEKDPEKRLERIDEFAAGLYLISQRMRGPVAVPAQVQQAIEPPPVDLPAPAFAPTFGAVKPAPVPAPAAPVVVLQPAPAPAPIVSAPVAASPVAPNVSAGTKSPKRAPASKPALSKAPWLPYAVAAVLTFCISLTLLSRQSMRASQAKPQATETAQPQTAAPVTSQLESKIATPAPAAAPPAVIEAQTPSQPAAPKQSEEQVLLNQVKYFWASGKYGLAMSKVDELLADYPDYMEGRIWKKKIRAAQEAEAAMK